MNLPDKIELPKMKLLDTKDIYLARVLDIVIDNQNQLIDYLKEKEQPVEQEPKDYSIEAFNKYKDSL